MMAHPSPLRRARALLDKSVVKKFPMFTNSYPNPGLGGRAPIIGFGDRFEGVGWNSFRARNVRLCELFWAFGRVLAGLSGI